MSDNCLVSKMMMRTLGVAVCGLLVLAGCTAKHYRASADKEVAGIIAQKSPAVPNMDPKFTIEANPPVSLAGLPTNQTVEAFLGAEGEKDRGVPVVALNEALDIAVKHNRNYQDNKESLYKQALSLTAARYAFTPIFSAGGTAAVSGESNPEGDQHKLEGTGSVGASWLMRDIGKLTTDLFASFSRFLVNGPSSYSTFSKLTTTFTRPLLRDAGFKADMEALTQSERDVLYQMRSFVHYRKQFSVQIASDYYGVLRTRDAIRNSYATLQSSRLMAERTRALAKEGRATQTALGRLEQQVLSSESSWISAIRAYQSVLDIYKITLGIPVQTRMMLDDRELQQLTIKDAQLKVEDCIKVALQARLDYQNRCDQQDDLVRHVNLAADQFKPKLDLDAAVVLNSPTKENTIRLPDPNNYSYTAGLVLDLPIERTLARNVYRDTLIAQAQAARDLDLARDEIERTIRERFRALEEARRNYEISEIGVRLNERRVEEQALLAELGRAQAQDQVDAQNALADSKNQLTRALVNHTQARLEFWRDMGILFIKDNGQWQEPEPSTILSMTEPQTKQPGTSSSRNAQTQPPPSATNSRGTSSRESQTSNHKS